MEKKKYVWLQVLLARTGAVLGWVGFAFFAFGTVVLLTHSEVKQRALGVTIFVILGLVFLLLALYSGKVRRRIKDFRYYARMLVGDKSVSGLSKRIGEPYETVLVKLREMCKRGYFNGYVDPEADCLVLESAAGTYGAKCPACGATTKVYKTGGVCRYCGNPLMIQGKQ